VFVLVSVTAVLLVGFRSSPPPVGPGDRIGRMTLVRGKEQTADIELWKYCDPDIRKPGRYRRTCSVPLVVQRLFIGYGEWELTRKALNSVWKQLKWDHWFDGSPRRLAALRHFRADAPRLSTGRGQERDPP
jgi:hypothetical protein